MAGGGPGGTQAFASTLTDLMTSLAIIFVLLLVVFLKQAHDQAKKAKEEIHAQLGTLLEEKSLSLRQDPDDPLKLIVMVGESQLRFPLGSAALSTEGAAFVNGFFRNFANRVCSPELRPKIDSVVIEGHTDTSGEKTPGGVRKNILLSQKRSYSVLEQALSSVQGDAAVYECLLKLTSANGRGSRMPIQVDGQYQADLSRRVEIKIQVRSAEQQFKAMADSLKPASANASER
ncbi:MAG: hypothetical protein NDJ89_09830 [Oligoflexia bacterium]|nr:hypothetical protein [Oligoflexia bacterium]